MGADVLDRGRWVQHYNSREIQLPVCLAKTLSARRRRVEPRSSLRVLDAGPLEVELPPLPGGDWHPLGFDPCPAQETGPTPVA